MRDRARVSRSAPVKLQHGLNRYTFSNLPAWIDEGSIRLSVSPSGQATIADVRVRKVYLAKAEGDDIAKAETAVQEVSDQVTAIEDEKSIIETQRRHLDQIRVFNMEKLPKDAALKDLNIKTFGEVVDFVGASLTRLVQRQRDLDKKLRELQPEQAVRTKTIKRTETAAPNSNIAR